jgi:hypothetical protein
VIVRTLKRWLKPFKYFRPVYVEVRIWERKPDGTQGIVKRILAPMCHVEGREGHDVVICGNLRAEDSTTEEGT